MVKRINLNSMNMVYICFMIVYMAIREVLPLNFIVSNALLSATIFAVGAILIGMDLLTSRNCLKGKTQDLLILFLLICGISSIINIKFGFVSNVKMIGTLIIEYFIFFSFAKCNTKEELNKKLNLITATLTIVWSIIVLFSVFMYFFNVDIIIAGRGTWGQANQGFSNEYSRLWGILQDPNYAGATSIVSLFASVRFFLKIKKVGIRILNALNVLLQVMYIILCGSRAAFLLLMLVILFFVVYRFLFSIDKKSFKQVARGILVSIITTTICITSIFSIKAAIPYVKAYCFPQNTQISKFVASAYVKLYDASGYKFMLLSPKYDGLTGNISSDDFFDMQDFYGENSDKPIIENIDRTDIKEDDISNGRFKRWKQTLEIFLNAPIFGTSPRNLSEFAKEHNPETIIAIYDIAPHNGYIDVLAGTGIIGFVAIALACIFVLTSILKDYLKNGFSQNRAFLLLAILVLMGIAFFVSDIFLVFSINSLLFWCLLGIAYNYGKDDFSDGYCYTLFSKTIGKLIDKKLSKKG